MAMTHLSIDGHLDCFHFSTTVKNAAVNMQCKYLFKTLFSISLNQYPETGLLLDPMIFYGNVSGTAIVFSSALAPFFIFLPTVHKSATASPHTDQDLLFYVFVFK